jgi:hypothetical protein
MRRRQVYRRNSSTAALAAMAALVATAVVAAPASAAADRVRVDVEVLDLAGKPLAGVDVAITTGSETVVVVTSAWGKARTRIAVAPGESVTVESTSPALVPVLTFADPAATGRVDAEFTAPVARGFDVVLTYFDLTGDTLWDTAFRRDNVGAQDDWIVLGGDLSVTTARFASHPIDAVYAANTDGAPGSELVALERQPDGTTHVWSYSPVTGSEDSIDAGILPDIHLSQEDFDGDGRMDLLFNSIWPTADGLEFTMVQADGDVLAFNLGGPDSWFDGEMTDVTGDGLTDVFANQVIPGQTIRWFVWESDDSTVRTKDMGTHGETPVTEGVLDGDGDGLVEFVGAFEVPGDDRGWEVLEWATGDYFEVIRGPEDDRGPSPIHYPPSWFTP